MTHWNNVIAWQTVSELLGTAALRSIVLALIAGLVLRSFRIKGPSERLLLWTTVLYGALAIPFLGAALPILPMPILAFLPGRSTTPPPQSISNSTSAHSPDKFGKDFPNENSNGINHGATVQRSLEKSGNSKRGLPSQFLPGFATLLYFSVVVALLIRFAIGLLFTHRLAKMAQEIDDPRLQSGVLSRVTVTPIPRVRESDAVSVPVTIGTLRPTILLPPAWREWDGEKLDAVLAHEISHVSRHDALTQCAALLHRAIFWFSPLAWWLNHQLAELAEQASDEAALSAGADRNGYARTLLEFFETLNATPQRVWWQGVSMAKTGQAEKRLERILTSRGAVSMHLKKTAITGIIALAIPVICLIAAVHPTAALSRTGGSQQIASPPLTATVPPEPAAPNGIAPPPVAGVPSTAPTAGVPGRGPITGVPAAAPIDGVAAVPAVPSVPGTPVQNIHSGTGHDHRYWYSYGSDDEQRFVIVTGNSDSLTMSGSSEDARHVEQLRKRIPGDFIWFQRDEKSYIIRDQATIDRARKLWAPQEELGKKQEELGRQQEALGKQQEELGARMEKVQVKVPDMTEQLDKLRAELKSLNSGATQEQIGKLQSEIGELQSQLGELQSHAGDQQSKIGEEMGELGEKQGKLGEQQGELGRQQGELAEKATKEMKQLLDEAIKNGKAQPEPEMSQSGSL